MSKIMELAADLSWTAANPTGAPNKEWAALKAEAERMEAELAEEKRLFTQLCGDHEKLAMEAQLLRGQVGELEVEQAKTAELKDFKSNLTAEIVRLRSELAERTEHPDRTKLYEALRAAEQAALHAKAMGQSEINRIMELHYKAAEEHKLQNWANPKAPFNQALQSEVSRMVAELVECKSLFDNETNRAVMYRERAWKAEAKLAALDGQQGEPVAWAAGQDLLWIAGKQPDNDADRYLYFSAGAREPAQPMTQAEITMLWPNEYWDEYNGSPDALAFARAVEKHHGIGAKS